MDDRDYEYKQMAEQKVYMAQMAMISGRGGGSGGSGGTYGATYGDIRNRQSTDQPATPTGPDKRLLLLEDTP